MVGVAVGAADDEGVGGLGRLHGSSVFLFLSFSAGGGRWDGAAWDGPNDGFVLKNPSSWLGATSRDPGMQTPAPMDIDAGVWRYSMETFVERVCLVPAPHPGNSYFQKAPWRLCQVAGLCFSHKLS